MEWTDSRVEMLKRLWRQGQSASQIAQALGGITRNAVIGKAHRLGLGGRQASATAVAPRLLADERTQTKTAASVAREALKPKTDKAPALAARSTAPAPALARPAAAPAANPTAAALKANLAFSNTYRTCQWPVGDPKTADFHFCGAESEAGRPYCTEHCAVAYYRKSDAA